MIGKTLAHYEITALIGKGGMGEVYRANDTKLGREIALKLLPADFAQQPERFARFKREATSLAALSHPNIVVIHSVEEDGGFHFLTMELVRGQTLDGVIPNGGLPLGRFFDLSISLTDAMHAAHRNGVMHRDLKPANIMVDDEGRLRVLDFGLAKLLDVGGADVAATIPLAGSGTGEGRVLGTAAYMSPEQAEGNSVDHRTDIFSLGIVLYEMATGQRPFRGDTQMSILSAILREDPTPVTELRSNLPRHLGRIIRRCLRKDPERRYQSAADVRNDLRDLREEMESGQLDAPVERPRSRHRWVTWTTIAVAAVAVAAAIWSTARLNVREREPRLTSSAQTPTKTPVTSSGLVTSGSISPDGNYVAFVVEEMRRASLHVKQLATGSEVEILPPSEHGIESARISPNGQHVFYVRHTDVGSVRRDLFRVPLLGGTPHRLIEDVTGDFALSPDGQRIAFFHPGDLTYDIFTAASDGSGERRLRSIDPALSTAVVAWSPTGETLLTATTGTDPAGSVLLELDPADGSLQREAVHRWTAISGMQYRADGTIFVVGRSGRQRFQDSSQLWVLDAFDAAPQVLLGDLADFTGVSLDRAGTRLATVARTRDQGIWVVPAAAPDRARRIDYIPRIGRWFLSPAWTRDSRILIEHREGETLHIRALATDGSRSSLLTTEGPFNMGASVSPDGKSLTFFSNRDGAMKIYLAQLDGTGVRRLTDDEWEEFFPTFGPDGKWVYYHTYDGTEMGFRVRRIRATGGASELLSESPAWGVRVSPDGQRLLVVVPDRQGATYAILPAEGGDPEPLDLEGEYGWTTWYPDGNALTSVDATEASIWVVPLDGSKRRKLATLPQGPIYSAAWNAGGDSLAVVTAQIFGDVVLVSGI